MAELITTGELLDFLGVDEANESLVDQLRASAIEGICRSTGIDWTTRSRVATFNEAVRTQVYLSFYGLRDEKVKVEHLKSYLTGLICSLQLCRDEEDTADGLH